MTKYQYDRQNPAQPSQELPSTPSKSAIIEILCATIDDLQRLQRIIQGVLEQEGHTDEERREMQQALRDAQDSERQARQDLEALNSKPEG